MNCRYNRYFHGNLPLAFFTFSGSQTPGLAEAKTLAFQGSDTHTSYFNTLHLWQSAETDSLLLFLLLLYSGGFIYGSEYILLQFLSEIIAVSTVYNHNMYVSRQQHYINLCIKSLKVKNVRCFSIYQFNNFFLKPVQLMLVTQPASDGGQRLWKRKIYLEPVTIILWLLRNTTLSSTEHGL